jgi:hypothetical protein
MVSDPICEDWMFGLLPRWVGMPERPTCLLRVKSRHSHVSCPMSALPPKADIVGRNGDVRFVLPAQPVDATPALNPPVQGCLAIKRR